MSDAEEKKDSFSLILDTLPVRIFWKDKDLRFLGGNKAFVTDLGMSCIQDIIGKTDYDFFSTEMANNFRNDDLEVLKSGVPKLNIEEPFQIQDQDLIWLETNKIPLRDEKNQIIGILGTYQNITKRKKLELEIEAIAHLDDLTGLPNRLACRYYLENKNKFNGETIEFLLFDLDNFKRVNDAMGHFCGDDLLKQVAERVKQNFHEDCFIARLGGDEFALVTRKPCCSEQLEQLASNLLHCFGAPFLISGKSINVSISVGITSYRGGNSSYEDVMREADIALYSAKNKGRKRFDFFDAKMLEHINKQNTLEIALEKALERKEIYLEFQPQINLGTGEIIGAESLIRWCHPEKGMIPPPDFIPIAEASGLIKELGAYVIEQAASQTKQAYLYGRNDLVFAVNLSARQIHEPGFAEYIAKYCEDNRIDPSRLEFELTESMAMSQDQDAQKFLSFIKGMGCEVAIDDFGTGYSSFHLLKEMPIDRLKIDRSFIRNITRDEKDVQIVTSILQLGNNLGLKVIVEGVETREDLKILIELGAWEIQGYFFSRPLREEKFWNFVKTHDPAVVRQLVLDLAQGATSRLDTFREQQTQSIQSFKV